ncbi:MAG: TonB-dependent receptor plug domain-containing protein [Candidatus Acidiferrum sp.]
MSIHCRRRGYLTTAAVIVVLLLRSSSLYGQARAPQQSLADVSIEDLMNVEVISASKKAESLSEAPAAIFVVSGEDIRRGGFSSIPDALRMVPGLHVAQQNAHIWVVAARGFSSLFNNKMLVLIDGRLVYSPEFGGVWWDVQDPPLEDIERIEVIRGPGGTLWGANAVNGVINIITKEAAKTQGVQVVGSAGVNEGYAARTRYGGQLGKDAFYRIYGTSNYWLPSVDATGGANDDDWTLSQGGMRVDWNPSPKNEWSFEGQGYSGRIHDFGLTYNPASKTVGNPTDFIVKGGHLLARWKHEFSEHSSADVLGYCDWTTRSDVFSGDSRNTCDVELQQSYTVTDRQSVTGGAAVLTTADVPGHDAFLTWNPVYRRATTFSVFAQYDLMLVPDRLRLIAGSKFEHNGYTGFEYQPQFRAVWTPKSSHEVWLAVSRAVRTPTRLENDVHAPVQSLAAQPPTLLFTVGDTDSQSELLHACELGYRYAFKKRFAVDASIYYNGYHRLSGSGGQGQPFINANPFFIGVPIPFVNLGGGQTHGLELYVKYTPVRRWTVSAGITELRGSSVVGLVPPAASEDPRHQVNVQSRLSLTKNLNWDAGYYYYSSVANASGPYGLGAVNRLDVGISTHPYRGFSFSVWGRDLTSEGHAETTGYAFINGEVPRSVVFKLIWESRERAGTNP